MHRRWALTLLVVAGTAGCSTRGLAFVEDDRVEVLAPRDRDDVTLPLTVQWSANDIPPGASFAVAVDVSPPRPGHAPDEDDQVVLTADTQVVLDRFGTTSRGGDSGLHQITVFLVDDGGARLGESAWRVEVELVDER